MESAFDGHADVSDPRKRYDDLIQEREVRELDRDEFARTREMEAFLAGWVAVGVVVDPAGRVLLAYHETDEQWVLPGGSSSPANRSGRGYGESRRKPRRSRRG